VATLDGGRLSRRTALALLAGVVASAGAHVPARPPLAHEAQYTWMLRQPMAEVESGQGGQGTPVAADYGRLAAFGSSTIDYAGPRFAREFQGMPFYNGGRAGEAAEETLARLGSRPVRVEEVTLPASGRVIVQAQNMPDSAGSMAPYAGTLAGVEGTLSTRGRHQGAFTFTRTDAGDPVEVSEGSAFRPGHGQRGGILILNLGKNNLSGSGGTDDVDTLLQWTRDAVAWNGEANTLVMGHFVNTHTPRTGSALREGVSAYNEAARSEFGGQCFDLGGFVTSSEVWEHAGITPTAADRRQQKAGNKPPSLSRDNAHLNLAGEAAMAHRIHEHLSGLEWLPAPRAA
jgi:hypothetical protein